MPLPAKPRFAFRDLVSEALVSLLARPGRTVLTTLGAVLGIGAIVATLGIAKTAGNQIVERFDALEATSVVVRPLERPGLAPVALPWDAEDRLTRLNGVVAAGTLTTVDTDLARSVAVSDPLGLSEHAITVRAVSPGLFDTVVAELRTGRFFDAGHSARGDRIAVLGRAAAQRLNVDRVDHQPAIFLGDEMLVVAGIIEDVAREPILLDSIIVPDGTARSLFDLTEVDEVHIRTGIGAAQLIASQAPVALHPDAPELLEVTAPPDPRLLREAVEEDVNALFLVLGGVALLIGAIGIANVTLVSVLERVGEIGLRRAVGAARRHIAGQFLMESAAMGAIGGLLGSAVGVLTVVGVSAVRTWTPVLDAWLPFAAPALGLVVGLLSGLYPSIRAARLEPVEALRTGM